MKIAIRISSSARRDSRAAAIAISGAPTTTPDRVGRDHIAGVRHARVKARRHLRQQAHDRELADADAEGAAGEREKDERQLPTGKATPRRSARRCPERSNGHSLVDFITGQARDSGAAQPVAPCVSADRHRRNRAFARERPCRKRGAAPRKCGLRLAKRRAWDRNLCAELRKCATGGLRCRGSFTSSPMEPLATSKRLSVKV